MKIINKFNGAKKDLNMENCYCCFINIFNKLRIFP